MPSRAGRSHLVAYVLHRYDWSESSLILDLFTREQGRLAVAAKGAKRPFSQLRSALLPFQRIHASLGRAPSAEETREVETLRGAEWAGGPAMLTGAALFNGFYANELLMKLLARHDPHPALFDAYGETLASLATCGEVGAQPVLRAFELVLLREIGLLPALAVETATRRPVRPGERYLVLADSGVVAAPGRAEMAVDGAALASLQEALDGGELAALQAVAARALAELRPIVRGLLHYHLGTESLRTRQVMRDAQALA